MRKHGAAIGALGLGLVLTFSTVAVGQTESPPPDRGPWRQIGELALARSGHTATLLPDDAILVVGGRNNAGRTVQTAELVFPYSGATRPAGTLPWGLSGHQALLLPDGRVLFSGSDSFDDSGFDTDEDHCADYPPLLWDPDTQAFSPVPGVSDSNGSSITRLDDGRVLFAGGGTACDWDLAVVGLDGAQLWDPLTGTVEDAGTLDAPRAFHPAAPLDDGQVLVAGGTRLAVTDDAGNSQAMTSFERWDPGTGEWTALGSLGLEPRDLVVLDDGRVAITGLERETDAGAVRLYDPAAEAFAAEGEGWPHPSLETAVAALPDGRLLFIGGLNKARRPIPRASTWDPDSGQRQALAWPRDGGDIGHTATTLTDGTVIVIGGRDLHRDGQAITKIEALAPQDR